MAENLNYDAKSSRCYKDKPENCEKYGRLYTWEEAMKACPSGWHLPSYKEWGTLVAFVGEKTGEKLKAKSGWNDYNDKSGNGMDDYGFSALPGGNGHSDGSFRNTGDIGLWWSSTEHDNGSAYDLFMHYGEDVGWWDGDKSNLFSVRCIKGLVYSDDTDADADGYDVIFYLLLLVIYLVIPVLIIFGMVKFVNIMFVKKLMKFIVILCTLIYIFVGLFITMALTFDSDHGMSLFEITVFWLIFLSLPSIPFIRLFIIRRLFRDFPEADDRSDEEKAADKKWNI